MGRYLTALVVIVAACGTLGCGTDFGVGAGDAGGGGGDAAQVVDTGPCGGRGARCCFDLGGCDPGNITCDPRYGALTFQHCVACGAVGLIPPVQPCCDGNTCPLGGSCLWSEGISSCRDCAGDPGCGGRGGIGEPCVDGEWCRQGLTCYATAQGNTCR